MLETNEYIFQILDVSTTNNDRHSFTLYSYNYNAVVLDSKENNVKI